MVSGPSAQPAGFHGYVGGVGCGQWAERPASRVSWLCRRCRVWSVGRPPSQQGFMVMSEV